MTRMSNERFLQGARTLIESALGIPELAKVLADYGYTPEKLRELLALIDEVDALTKQKDFEYGEQYEASSELAKAWEAANVVYSKTLKLARIALGDDAKGVTALRLIGSRKQSLAGWYGQASTLYDNILKDPGFIDRMKDFGYTDARLRAERAVMADVMDKFRIREQETGSALASTATRDLKFGVLDSKVSDFRGVCEVAFYDDRAQLEKMGPLAPTLRRRSPRRKKPAA